MRRKSPIPRCLLDDLGVDSLMAMEVMVTVDKKFKIDIPEDEFSQIKNVNDAVATVMRYLSKNGASHAV
jgi:acyl carrier protein